MCRNIKNLHNFEPPATEQEIRDACLQFVRKVSGSTKPSQANQAVFDQAVTDVSKTINNLLSQLVTCSPPKNRELEAEKARIRSQHRFNKSLKI